MNTPLLVLGDCLIATLVDDLKDSEWSALRDQMLATANARRATAAVVDVSALELLDSYAGRALGDLAQMLTLRGVAPVIVGIQPDVALSMAVLGMRFPGLVTELDLERGLARLGYRLARIGPDGS